MTKAELIKAVQEKMGADTSASLAGKVVDAMLETIAETLKSGGEASLTGIGTLRVKARAARMGRNPKTGEAIAIPAQKAVTFSVAKPLKDAVK